MKKWQIIHIASNFMCVEKDMENNSKFPFKETYLYAYMCNVDLLKLSTIFTQTCIPRFKHYWL